MSMIDHIVFLHMIQQRGTNIGDIFLPAVCDSIEKGRRIMDGFQQLLFRDVKILGSLKQDFSADALVSEYFRDFFSNFLSVAIGSS